MTIRYKIYRDYVFFRISWYANPFAHWKRVSTNCTGRVVLGFCVTCIPLLWLSCMFGICINWRWLYLDVETSTGRQKGAGKKINISIRFWLWNRHCWEHVCRLHTISLAKLMKKYASHKMFIRAPLPFPLNRSSVCAYLNSNS